MTSQSKPFSPERRNAVKGSKEATTKTFELEGQLTRTLKEMGEEGWRMMQATVSWVREIPEPPVSSQELEEARAQYGEASRRY